MNALSFTTINLKRSDQLQSWQEWFSPAFEVTPLESDHSEFKAQNSLWNIGSLGVSHVVAPAVHVRRSKKNVKMVPEDHWMLACCRQGATTIKTPKGEFVAPAQVPFFWSFGEEFESKRSHVERIQVLLPRNKLGPVAPLLDTIRGSALMSPLGTLVGEYVFSIERHLSTLTETDGDRVVTTLGHMIAACVDQTVGRRGLARTGISSGIFERARRTIEDELDSPRLQPSKLCYRLGVSRSQLYRLFEPHGGVAHYIQKRRLLRIFESLGDPEGRESIADLAARYGFEDPSSFSRAFKREFGCSPRDVRDAGPVK